MTEGSGPEQEWLGKYRLETVLGAGAMGVVYRAYDPAIDRRVAIKTVREAGLPDEIREEFRARFRREAQAAGRLGHPNIVAVHDVGEANGVAFLVMEYVEGQSLKQALDSGRHFNLESILVIIRQVLDALGHAHAKGVVHRDIKPANILLTPEGRVKLTDFGIARLEDLSMTQTGQVLGTPSYMSPEQVRGLAVGPAADLYATGIVLYELLTRDKPFTGSLTTVLQKIVAVVPPAPSLLNADIPTWLDAVLARAIAKQPEDRFPNAQAFAEALVPPGASTANTTWGSAHFVTANLPPAGPAAATEASAQPVRRAGGRRWAWLGALMVLLLAGGALGWWQFGDRLAGMLGLGGTTVALPGDEAQAWERVSRDPTAAALRAYIQAFPAGAHLAEAQQRLAEREREAAEAAARLDDDRIWEVAVRAGTPEALRGYLQAHPDGVHAEEARRRLAELEAAARTAEEQRAEQAAWDAADQANTAEGFRAYLAARPDGAHAEQARQRLAALGAPPPDTSQPASLTGIWTGRYHCNQGVTGATLDIRRANEDGVDAVVSTFALPQNPGVPSARIRMHGRYDPGPRRLDFLPGRWIHRPPGWSAGRMEGVIDAEGMVYRGSVIGVQGCTDFAFRRGTEPPPDTSPAAGGQGAGGQAAGGQGAGGSAAAGQVLRDCPDCPEVVVLPAGQFAMGSAATEANHMGAEEPVHTVTIGRPFAMGRTEVTRAQFAAFITATGYSVGAGCEVRTDAGRQPDPNRTWQNPGFTQTDQDPVVCVSWLDAQAYVAWLSQRTGQTYRLPSEAEWEYAARGGTTTPFYWGSNAEDACTHGNVADLAYRQTFKDQPGSACSDSFPRTAPVGRFGTNPFGLADMIGNAWEWTQDCFSPDYRSAPTDGSASGGSDCTVRTGRGGAWDIPAAYNRSALRGNALQSMRADETGFRVVRELGPPGSAAGSSPGGGIPAGWTAAGGTPAGGTPGGGAAAGGPAASPSAVAGAWRGLYRCQQQIAGFDLTITSTGPGTVAATFGFYPVPNGANIPTGSFRMSGEFDAATGRLVLRGEQWIHQPPNFLMVSLEGTLAPRQGAGPVITGYVTGPGCNDFRLERIGGAG